MTDMTLTLPKADLTKTLEDRRKEVYKEWSAPVDDLKEALKNLSTVAAITAPLIEWHEQVAEGLRDGTITLNDRGALTGAPKRPSTKTGRTTYEGWSGWSKEQLEERLEGAKGRRKDACRPLDTAIHLLSLSTDTEVTIKSADYQNLLAGTGRRY